MDDLQKLLIERECERLVTRYCHLVDHGQAARIADLFTEDGVWASPEATMTGREQIPSAARTTRRASRATSAAIC